MLDAWQLGPPDSSLVIIDRQELDRFSRTYYGIPPLPADLRFPRDEPIIFKR
jgi:hypothetical protein